MMMNRIGILDKKIITKPCHCSYITNIKHHYSLQFVCAQKSCDGITELLILNKIYYNSIKSSKCVT